MEVIPLGIGVCRGKHTNKNIISWSAQRLQYLGLDVEDLGSTTTDSGPKVGKAMWRLAAP